MRHMGTSILDGIELAIDVYDQDGVFDALDLDSCCSTTRKIRHRKNAGHIPTRPGLEDA